jgi:hypothetical protein
MDIFCLVADNGGGDGVVCCRQKGIVISLHPGTTDTALSAPFQKNVAKDKLFSTEYSVQQMLAVIDSLTIEDSGKFYAYDGSDIEW